MFLRRRPAAGLLAPTALILAAVLMSGCSDKPVPPCPAVRVDRDTEQLIKFAEGTRHDPTDVEYGVQMVGYEGICKYKKKTKKHPRQVEVSMSVTMDLVRGPAAKDKSVTIPYFIALPQFFPTPAGKRVITVTRELPAHQGARERIVERDIRVVIPLNGEEPGAAYDVYTGFQLTPEDLAFNRSQQPGGAAE